jgi:hypothetical protein
MQLMEKHPEIMSMRPLTGPPKKDGEIHQKFTYETYEKDFERVFKFKFFSSRVYLINHKRSDKLLPLSIIWRSYRQKFFNKLPDFCRPKLTILQEKVNLTPGKLWYLNN